MKNTGLGTLSFSFGCGNAGAYKIEKHPIQVSFVSVKLEGKASTISHAVCRAFSPATVENRVKSLVFLPTVSRKAALVKLVIS